MEQLRRDLVLALRRLRRARGFAATAIGLTALGIGANAAVFGVVDPLLDDRRYEWLLRAS